MKDAVEAKARDVVGASPDKDAWLKAATTIVKMVIEHVGHPRTITVKPDRIIIDMRKED